MNKQGFISDFRTDPYKFVNLDLALFKMLSLLFDQEII